MKNSNSKNNFWVQFFFAFGILATISGIYLIFQENYITGIFGTITGLFLIYLQKGKHTKTKE